MLARGARRDRRRAVGCVARYATFGPEPLTEAPSPRYVGRHRMRLTSQKPRPLAAFSRLPHHAARLAMRSPARCAVLLVLAAFATGCASSGSAPVATGPGPAAPAEGVSEAAAVEHALRRAAEPWLGTPHRWGGTTRRGVDCSGLTGALYRDALRLDLPRQTGDQVRLGRRVRRDALQPGDLVFFKTGGKLNHVGVHLADGAFVHASSSRGVAVSHLSEPYWQRTYWTTRRVLHDLDDAPVAARRRPADAAPSRDEAPRGGW